MKLSGNTASIILMSIGVFMIAARSYARLGDGPRIDELIAHADVVCAGRITGYESVTVAGQDGGSSSTWLAARFAVDHRIKGSILTNSLVILMNRLERPEAARDVLAQLGAEKRTSRFLVFLKTTDMKASQFKLVDDMNGMIEVALNAPLVEGNAGTEERIEAEMAQGQKQLGPGKQEQIKAMSEKWHRGTRAVTNRQEDVRGSGH
jgi:pimeloyl-ACP methyl ester carboxylesterase